MHHFLPLAFCVLLFGSIVSCTSKKSERKNVAPKLSYTIQKSFPHDTKAFTEGLLIHNGELYESTGKDESWIGIVDIKNGVVDKKVVLGKEYFGEGIAILNNKVYQLTFETHKGFVYTLGTFKEVRQFSYKTPAWGLTHDASHLIMSDGSERLYFLDTTSLLVVKTLTVIDESGPLTQLNELEFIDGFIYANVWLTDRIVKIDPSTGQVKGVLDLTTLCNSVRRSHPQVNELNGIAWHPATKLLLVTGKYWPAIYALKLKN